MKVDYDNQIVISYLKEKGTTMNLAKVLQLYQKRVICCENDCLSFFLIWVSFFINLGIIFND